MQRGILLTALVASATSAVVTVLLITVLLPSALHAQGEPSGQLTLAPLTVTRADGLAGMTADVAATGGGVVRILGTDGKTVRVSIGAGGGTPPNPVNAGLSINNANGNQVARIGTITDTPALGAIPAGVRLQDAQGHARLLASLDQDGNPSIQLFDAAGTMIWSAP